MVVKDIWNRIGREALVLLIGQALTALGGLVAMKLLTRYLPKEVYGLGWLFINGATFFAMVLSGSLAQSLNRFYHDEGGQKKIDQLLGLIWRMEILGTLLIGIIYLLAISIFGYFKRNEWLAFGVMPVYFFFLSFLSMTQVLLNTSRKRVRRVVLAVTEAWLRPAGALLVCFLWRPDVNSFVLGYASASFLTGSLGMIWMRGYGSRAPFKLPLPDKEFMSQVLSYSFPWVGFTICSWVSALSDRYMVNWYLGNALTGTYVAAYQVGAALFQLLGGSWGALVQPILFQRTIQKNAVSAENITAVFRAFAWISLPLLAFFIVFHEWLMRWLVAPAYWSGSHAVFLVGIGVYLSLVGDRAMDVFLIAKKTGAMMKINAVSAFMNILLNLLLIPYFGIIGAALSTCLTYAFYAVNMVFWGQRLLPWRFPYHSFLFSGLILTIAVAFSVFLHHTFFEGRYDLLAATSVFCAFVAALSGCAWLLRSHMLRDYYVVTR